MSEASSSPKLGSIGVAKYRSETDNSLPSGLPGEVETVARENIDGAVAGAGQLPAELGSSLLRAARDAFASGFNVAAAVSAGIALAGAVLAAVALRHVPPTGVTTATPEPGQQGTPDNAAVERGGAKQ